MNFRKHLMHTKNVEAEEINETETAKTKIMKMLEPCFTDPPTAAAVLVINSEEGTAFFNLNMDTLELIATLINTGVYMQNRITTHSAPETLQ
jgi:hypothetical protein